MSARFAVVVSLACALACACSKSSKDDDAPPPGTVVEGAGAADPAYLLARKLDWIHFETAKQDTGSTVNTLAQLARERLEPGYVPPGSVPANAYDADLASMDALDDGRDFVAVYMLNVLLQANGNPYIPAELLSKIEDALARYKYWFTQPTPAGKTDNSYYWSENHQILYHTIEYLMGTRLPDRPIGTDGRLGRDHAADARAQILAWLDHRARFGFSEWYSNVYYQKDLDALLTLVEFTPDEEMRARVSMALDVLFLDLAQHTLRDAFGVTHGRSYKKDKLKSTDEDTWSLTKLLFGQSTYDYGAGEADAALFAIDTKYVYPEVIRRAGADTSPLVVRERIGIPIQEEGPIEDDPPAAFGLTYEDKDLMTWWGMAALTAYPVVGPTLATFNQYDLWDNGSFSELAQFRSLAASPDFARNLSSNSWQMINFGLLKQVETYTWRTPDVMLSSAVDYRKGCFNDQMQSWQATFDARAIVFTNHPFRPLATTGDWLDDNEDGGYWNGEASAPRSGQVENVAIHIYAPQYPITSPAPFDYFHYEPYTHAYFPQDYFDEVVTAGNWTFGRFQSGYIALYSFRAPKFLVYDGTTQATDGRVKPFDLIAAGGADNVWITEVARASEAGSFQDFQTSITGAAVTVTPRGPGAGYDVSYASPSQGLVTFGWEAPLVRRGETISLTATGRYESPYATVPENPTESDFINGPVGVKSDLVHGRRVVFGPK